MGGAVPQGQVGGGGTSAPPLAGPISKRQTVQKTPEQKLALETLFQCEQHTVHCKASCVSQLALLTT
jgi:hypothetical protein